MEQLARRLYQEIRKIPLIDPHSHIAPAAPAARSLNDLLGYHYYTELAHSAGMPKRTIESTHGREQVRQLVRYLDRVSNTVQYQWLMEIAREFFGFTQEELNLSNVDGLCDAIEAATAAPHWPEDVFAKTHLEAIFLTNEFDDPLEGFDLHRYVPCLRTDDLVFKLDQSSVRERLQRATQHDVGKIPNLRDAIGVLFKRFVRKHARACAISLPPDFEPFRPNDASAAKAYERVLLGQGSDEDRRLVSYAVFYTLADFCEEFALPFDLMIGVRRQVYQDGVYQGQDLFDQRTSLYQYRHLFNEKRTVVFPISVLTHQQNQELVSFAWIFPNVITSGHWWYSNIPTYIELDVRARLEAVPRSKQIGYYSDAYKLEFVLPKFNMYRRCLANVLAREFVLGQGWSEAQALALARAVLRDNVEQVFPKRDAGQPGDTRSARLDIHERSRRGAAEGQA